MIRLMIQASQRLDPYGYGAAMLTIRADSTDRGPGMHALACPARLEGLVAVNVAKSVLKQTNLALASPYIDFGV